MKRLPAVRERTEELERASLSTWAAVAIETKGRDVHEEPDPLRTAYQVDRDRILASEAFAGLKHKSHLLLGGGRRRLRAMHALELAQVGRTIGRGLRLNEDLIEAVALGHDLGNTAFGIAGEQAVSIATGEPFAHAEQSLRVVERLANNGAGLNLTWEVRDGIVGHGPDTSPPVTLEGQVVRIAERIVTVTHDLREAVAAGVLHDDDIPKEVVASLGATHEERRESLIGDLVAASLDRPELSFTPRVAHAMEALVETLGTALDSHAPVQAERNRAAHCLSSIAVYYLNNDAGLPPTSGDRSVRVADAVSALTDRGALEEFSRLFLPSP